MSINILNEIWNDFFLTKQLLGVGNEILTLDIAISSFDGSYNKQCNMFISSPLMIMIPIIIVFLFTQKQILKGMVDGAIK
ncbi:hypothetical protein [Facklamia sp. 7083-14-GEN3]|uniref:hypothetical protein n=1 Tax=Facklamia sp. 7083-14-GEN3 TaxID=2973478 RepID=UPI00215CF2C7|nr:hypothetical protein [Facklamia sp. 7083-14-GEN3]MCR8968408.1 hypothetical protein [Facklamia sp. 7083-14-GEN3]